MPEAVVFDLYETLVTESGFDVPRASALARALGLDDTAYRVLWKQQRPRVLVGQLSFREALNEIGSKLGVTIAPAHIEEACEDRIRAKAEVFGRIRPDVLALTHDLSARGVRLGVVSNCFAEDVSPWSRCGLAHYFGCLVCSFEVGVAKPDPQIYRIATDRLGVAAADTVYVGDGGDDELIGAERAGLRVAQATWFVSRPFATTTPRLGAPEDVWRLVAGVKRG